MGVISAEILQVLCITMKHTKKIHSFQRNETTLQMHWNQTTKKNPSR